MAVPTIYHKLRTNDPPTDEEAAAVRRAMEQSLNKLKALENETTLLRERLAVLCQKKKDTQDFVMTHRSLVSPVRRLHRDVLQEIFYQCLPTAHNSVPDPDAAPLVLGRVCSSWRQIAYSTPKLWSSLHIGIALLPLDRASARHQALSSWLYRSGALPLSLSMYAAGFAIDCARGYVSIESQVPSYLNLMLTHAKRWKRIHLTLLQYDWAIFYHLVNASDLPLLEVLHLEGERMGLQDPQSFDISYLSRSGGILSSPLLRDLSLPDYSPRLLDLPIQWSRITGLNFTHHLLPLQRIIKIFTICPDLQKCSITISTVDEPSFHANASNIPPVVLPNLRTLKLIRESGPIDDILTLINKLWAPKLRHFAYEQRINQRGSPFVSESLASEPVRLVKSLCSFFQRLNEPLEEFDYWSDSFTRRDMTEVLSCLPGLKRLSLKDFSAFTFRSFDFNEFDDRFLAQFIPHEHRMRYLCDEDSREDSEDEEGGDGVEEDRFPESICLCPKLEVLNAIEAVYSERVLLEFLRSRSSVDHHTYNVSHLRRASITFKDVPPEHNTRGRIRDMAKHISDLEKDTGLVVQLKYSPVPLLLPSTLFRYDPKSPYNGIHRVPVSFAHSNYQLGFIKFDV